MPATSQQQQKLFGLALSVKRGETPRSEVSDDVLQIVDTMSEKKIKDFAETSHSGLPTKVESLIKSLVRDNIRTKVLGEATKPDKVSKYWTGQSPIQKMFSKIGFIGSEWTHSELKNQLKNLSDQSLKMLYDELKSNKGIKSSDPLAYMFRNTSKDYQQKLTKLEMEKRGLLEANTTKVLGEASDHQLQTILEGVDDPGILKCIFMAGGPGSGKSFVVNDIFGVGGGIPSTAASGLKVVASDVAFEAALKKNGINPKDLATIEKENPELWDTIINNPDSIRNKAKALTDKQQKLYELGRLGMIIDGTGHKYSKISYNKKYAESLGYDCYMIFVNTSLEVALERNKKRSRTLPDDILKDSWKNVQENLGKFQELFGNNFKIVDNTVYKPIDSSIQKAVASFIRNPTYNKIGKEWIRTARLLKRAKLIEGMSQYRDVIDKYVKGNMYYSPNNLGYSRVSMPQIEDEQQINFFKYLDSGGVKFSKKNITIDNIIPAQKDLRVDVATDLLKSNSPKLKKPLLISSDMYLMDGHHRWLALMFDNPTQKLNVIVIGVTGKKLLEIMRNFDGVKFKSSD